MSENEPFSKSCLYVVATPIGHLDDISQRALSTLSQVDLILAEDTRETQQLLRHYQITTPLKASHEHNERAMIPMLIDRLKQGEAMALVSDRGTPLISDPGYPLVSACQEAGIRVAPVPGPCALIAALSVAGLPTDRFCFEGFLPAKSQQRETVLLSLLAETRTLVFYESVHRIEAMLASLMQVFGKARLIVVARELTKQFETLYRGTCDLVLQELQAQPQQIKGEFVVCVKGAIQESSAEKATVSVDQLLLALVQQDSVKMAAKIASDLTGLPKNALYERALYLKSLSH